MATLYHGECVIPQNSFKIFKAAAGAALATCCLLPTGTSAAAGKAAALDFAADAATLTTYCKLPLRSRKKKSSYFQHFTTMRI